MRLWRARLTCAGRKTLFAAVGFYGLVTALRLPSAAEAYGGGAAGRRWRCRLLHVVGEYLCGMMNKYARP